MPLDLFTRFPTLRDRSRPGVLVPPAQRQRFPALADDLVVLQRHLLPAFEEYDQAAQRHQNRYRRDQVVVLVGSALATGLGGLQAALPNERWPAVLLAVIGIVLAAASRLQQEHRSVDAYLDARVKAERLRALHFRYLARTGRYRDEDRAVRLEQDVADVRLGRDPR